MIGELRSENGRYSCKSVKISLWLSKGNQVNIPEPGHGDADPFRGVERGNANELGDVNESPGKSYLFFLRGGHPGNGSAGDRVVVLEKHHGSCGVRCALAGP